MPLTLHNVEQVARLARLALTEEEKARFRDQLAAVLAYVQQLDALDLDDVPETALAAAGHSVMRPDEVRSSLSPDEALHNAAASQAQQFRIQAVLDE